MTHKIGEITQVWRYPVKSLGGERCRAVQAGTDGFEGDRRWAIWDETWNQLASGKQFPDLMRFHGRYEGDPGEFGIVAIVAEDGERFRSNDPWALARLSARLGRSVGLRQRPLSAEGEDRAIFRNRQPVDPARFLANARSGADAPGARTFPGDMDRLYGIYLTTPGLFADCSPVHLVSRQTLAALGDGDVADVRRYRPNLLVDLSSAQGPFLESSLIDERIRIGDAVLQILVGTPRCSMPSSAQPGLPQNWDVGAAVARAPGKAVGVYADVIEPGPVREGDAIQLCPVIFAVQQHPRYRSTPQDEATFARLVQNAEQRLVAQGEVEPPPGTAAMRVAARTPETQAITSFTLIPTDGRPLPRHLPGQHLKVTVMRGGERVSRHYTISSSPLDPHWRISVKREGDPAEADAPAGIMSHHLHDTIAVGDVVHATMPAGSFHTDPADDAPLLLVSMGIGITPMISIVRTMVVSQPDRDIHLVHGARTMQDVAFLAEIGEAARLCPNLRLTLCLSGADQAAEPAPSWLEVRYERLTPQVLDAIAVPAWARVMMCGTEGFMIASAAFFKARHPDVSVDFELFSAPVSTPVSGKQDATILFARSGVTATWTGEDASLLEMAERHRLRVDFDCRAGICGRCANRKISGTETYFSETLRPRQTDRILLCCSVPAGESLVIDL